MAGTLRIFRPNIQMSSERQQCTERNDHKSNIPSISSPPQKKNAESTGSNVQTPRGYTEMVNSYCDSKSDKKEIRHLVSEHNKEAFLIFALGFGCGWAFFLWSVL